MRFPCVGILVLAVASGAGFQAAGQARQTAEAEFPACHPVRIESPDRNWVLISNAIAPNCPGQGGHSKVDLSLKTASTGQMRPVKIGGWGGAVRWAPDSSAFSLNDYLASNEHEAYLYRTRDLKRVDLRNALLQSDRSVERFMGGHSYVRALRWLGGSWALVDLCGHTDESPVVQFDARYEVSLDGSVRKLSEKVGPPDERECAGD